MRKPLLAFVVVGMALSGLVGAAAGWFADDAPDGLTRVARDEGFAVSEREHSLADSPVSGYRVDGIEDEDGATAVAGLAGILLTFLLGTGGAAALRARQKRAVPAEAS